MEVRDGKRVLLVEDNEDNRRIYTTILRHHGYEVIQTTNGREAVRLAHQDPPDIVLLDVTIPGLDGWTVASRLKSDASTRDLPIILLTSHALERDRRRARVTGCEAYLSKPVRPPEVLEAIRRLTGG